MNPQKRRVSSIVATLALVSSGMSQNNLARVAGAPGKESPAKRAERFVIELASQRGQWSSSPGYPHVLSGGGFAFIDQTPETPADKLYRLHLAAVPMLIKALNDKRLTKTIQGEVGGMKSAWLGPARRTLRVRDAAVQILSEIAGLQFSKDEEGILGDSDGEVPAVSAKVKAWWKDVQVNGEKQVLIREVSRGHYRDNVDIGDLAMTLAYFYPRSALAAIKANLAHGADKNDRQGLITALQYLRSKPAFELARDEMLTGRDAETRVCAAGIVQRYSPEMAAHAMAREWCRLIQVKASNADDLDHSGLIDFLAVSGYGACARALSGDLRDQPISRRIDILWVCYDTPIEPGSSRYDKRIRPPEHKEFSDNLEDLLASELSDRQKPADFYGKIGELVFGNPRACDVAAYMLAFHWPKKYSFSYVAPETERDAACLRALTEWKRSRKIESPPTLR